MEADGAKILVVDDIPENVRLLEAVLVPRGYQVFPAMSGEEDAFEEQRRLHSQREEIKERLASLAGSD